MADMSFVRSALLMALVPPKPEEPPKTVAVPSKTAKALGSSRSETSVLEAFLGMNPEEKFDLESVNSIDPRVLLEEARGEKKILRDVVRTAEALLPRVRAETEDPILVNGILRKKTLDWYRQSVSDRTWAERMPVRWGGIFHESRVPGGRLSRKLSVRLTTLINDCVGAAGAVAFLRAGVTGIFRGSAMMAKMVQFSLGSKRPRLAQQVAQAYLDDLAANPRQGNHWLPLMRLSDLARRNGSSEINMTLGELFPHEVVNQFIVVDPRFHPGMTSLIIRVVPARNPEEPSTYDLIQGGASASRDLAPLDSPTSEAGSGSPWEREGITKKDWLAVLKGLQKRKERLDPPPRENPRDRESYLALRELLLTESAGRKAFLTVHWKGRPTGLVLLCQLLVKGSLVPEVETDSDYLEAELDHPDRGESVRRKEGEWDIGYGWTVVRELSNQRVRTYRASGKSGD